MKKLFTFVIVAVMALGAHANVLTVCEGGGYSSKIPVYGAYADTEGCLTQMIYPADMLSSMSGGEITQVQFITMGDYLTGNASDYINYSTTLQLSLKVVEDDVFFDLIPFDDVDAVAATMTSRGDGRITFDLYQPFYYEGGNLLVEVKVIEPGSYGTTYFAGENVGIYSSLSFYTDYSNQSFIELSDFMPMANFTYEGGTPSTGNTRPLPPGFTMMPDYIDSNCVNISLIPQEGYETFYRYGYTYWGETDWSEWEDYYEGYTTTFLASGQFEIEAYSWGSQFYQASATMYVSGVIDPYSAPLRDGISIEPSRDGYKVTFIPKYGGEKTYRWKKDNGNWTDWMTYQGVITFTEEGTYTFESPGMSATFEVYGVTGGGNVPQTGDVDGDGKVNIDDVTTLINMLLNGGTTSSGADVDANGKVNIDDVTTLINLLLNGGH